MNDKKRKGDDEAAARRAKIMAKMSALQHEFLVRNIETFKELEKEEGDTPSEQSGQRVGQTKAGRYVDTRPPPCSMSNISSMSFVPPPCGSVCMGMGICMGLEVNMAQVEQVERTAAVGHVRQQLPAVVDRQTCILCLEEDAVTLDSKPMVYTALIQSSNLFCPINDPNRGLLR